MQQHPVYAAACAAIGTPSRCFELPGSTPANPHATALVLERRVPFLGRAALLSRGAVWHSDLPLTRKHVELQSLVALLRSRNRLLAMTQETPEADDAQAGSGGLAVVTPGHLGLLDLTGGKARMRSRQNGKWRNRLVRAEREALAAGLRIWQGAMPPDPGHWLFRAEDRRARDNRYRRLPTSFSLAWLHAGGPEGARLFTVERDGAPIAAMLFLLYGASARYHIGRSGCEGRTAGVHNLLLWEAQTRFAEEGFRQLEFDLIDTRGAPGLARFNSAAVRASSPLGRHVYGRREPVGSPEEQAVPQRSSERRSPPDAIAGQRRA